MQQSKLLHCGLDVTNKCGLLRSLLCTQKHTTTGVSGTHTVQEAGGHEAEHSCNSSLKSAEGALLPCVQDTHRLLNTTVNLRFSPFPAITPSQVGVVACATPAALLAGVTPWHAPTTPGTAGLLLETVTLSLSTSASTRQYCCVNETSSNKPLKAQPRQCACNCTTPSRILEMLIGGRNIY